jgi:hypothetical protein
VHRAREIDTPLDAIAVWIRGEVLGDDVARSSPTQTAAAVSAEATVMPIPVQTPLRIRSAADAAGRASIDPSSG